MLSLSLLVWSGLVWSMERQAEGGDVCTGVLDVCLVPDRLRQKQCFRPPTLIAQLCEKEENKTTQL